MARQGPKFYQGYIGNSGKENGNYYSILGLCRE